MKRYRIALFCGAFVLAGGILNFASAEGPNAAAQNTSTSRRPRHIGLGTTSQPCTKQFADPH